MSSTATFTDNPLWRVRSDLPGRLRLISQELVNSPLLRHHCAVTLTSCHWLRGFRINSLQGSVVVRFPDHRRSDLIALLQDALSLPRLDDELRAPLAQLRSGPWRASRAGQMAIRHGASCGVILLAELLFPIPPLLMTGAALVALVPLVREVWHEWHHKQTLPAEALELAFSGALLSRGLAGEALLDLAISDASDALEGLVSDEDEFHPASTKLIDRLGNLVSLELVDDQRASCSLVEARLRDRYRVASHSHVFLESRVIEGEIVVLNRLVDGDWRPRRLRPGDEVYPGAFLIKGQGVLEVINELNMHPHYQIPLAIEESKHHLTRFKEKLKIYNRLMTPLLLGVGGLWFALGAVERALGLLQFNPIHDWETSILSSRLTAMASLRLHGIHLNDPDALKALGKVKHLVIGRSCLDRMGGIQAREHLHPGSGWGKGDMVRLLAGLQDYLLENDEAPIWSTQLHLVHQPMQVDHVEIDDLLEGWVVRLSDGRQLRLKQQPQSISEVSQVHLDPLEIWEGDGFIGSIELITEPAESWIGVCEVLEEMGVNIHLVGVEDHARMLELMKPLGLHRVEHLYGNFLANDRLELVRDLQRNGDGVAYMGYVLQDIPGLCQADVSIGIEVDADSIFTTGICDVVIGPDVHWLPRMIQMSRRLEATANSNFALIGGSSLLAGIAASALWINPLTTVLLADVPLVLAELRNITALSSHGVFDTDAKRHRALQPPPPSEQAVSCQLRKACP